MTQAQDYAAAAREFLAKAQEEATRGELTQASEKGWGAAAQMVKAVAEQRGWAHNGHALLFRVIRRLVEETRDEQLDTQFHVANSLHSNFYEDWLPQDLIQVGLRTVERLVEKLERLIK